MGHHGSRLRIESQVPKSPMFVQFVVVFPGRCSKAGAQLQMIACVENVGREAIQEECELVAVCNLQNHCETPSTNDPA